MQSSSHGRQDFPHNTSAQVNTTEPLSHHLGSSTRETLPAGTHVARSTHSRETSVTGGRGLTAVNAALSSLQSQQHVRAPSPRSHTTARPGPGLDGGVERRPSLSYGHHRQTSIVHGIQHSRNASFVNQPATSPISPQVIAAAGVGSGSGPDTSTNVVIPEMDDPSWGRSGTSGSFSRSNTITSALASDRSTGDSGQKRLERMHSGKSRRDYSRNHSQSRHHHQPELKTVGEYALHHLFNSFVGQADRKINQCINSHLDIEPQVEQICGPGVDAGFDQLISALGHIARQKPKPLIDTLMFWRKAKSEAANAARNEFNQIKGTVTVNGILPRRNTEPLHILAESNENGSIAHGGASLASRQEAVIQAERRSTISIYLLCRVLMEIIGQSSLANVTPEMADRLEDIIFSQLKAADPDQLAASPLRLANWSIFAQLLGVMSDINFESVSDRYFADLEKSQKDPGGKGNINKEHEGKVELVIMGMRYLRIKIYPDEAWERSCDFIQGLGRFFANAHGQRIKHAYCQILEKLLLPIAAKASTELNVPKWKEAIEIINPRLTQMLLKPRHWSDAFPLMTILLCVSPTDVFASQWLGLVSPLQPKMKDRATRPSALRSICRLTWTYLYRCNDTLNVTVRKLEEVMKMVFPAGKRSYISTDPVIAEPLIQLIRIIGFKHQDLCFRTIIFPLINSDLFTSGKELKVEQLEPEKMVIGIKAFLAIMTDLEKGDQGRPPFPETFGNVPVAEPLPASPLLLGSRLMADVRPISKCKEERLSRPVLTTDFGDAAKEYYARFCEILGKITLICDNAFGGQAVLDEKFGTQTPKTPIAETFGFTRKDEHQAAMDQKQGFYDLLHVAVQALPRCLSAHIPFNALINLLCTGTAHVQSNIAASSAQSLKSIARQSHAQQVTIGFARFIFNFDDRYSTMSDGGMLGPGHIENTLRLYVELLEIWIEEIKHKTKEAAQDPSEEGSSGSRGVQLDLSGVLAYVDEIESHGLFFLCSQSRRVRSFAVTVLRLITEFDTALGKTNMRIISIMEGDSQRVMDSNDQHLTVAERSRLQGKRKANPQSILIELCSSDNSYDAPLWFKIFPNLVSISFEICPFAVTLSREIICARLLQMHKSISTIADGQRGPPYTAFDIVPSRPTARLSSTPPEVMIEQWKLYLIMACTTLTNTGGQQEPRLAIGQHTRKGSKASQQGMDRITSARSLFSYITPLLSVGPSSIRDAVVVALGSININLYKTLLESLQTAVTKCNEEAKIRIGSHQRTASSPRRNRRTDRLRTEVTHVYKLTSHFLREKDVYDDDWILNNLVTYTKDIRIFLSDAEVQSDWEFQKLRQHYCGLMEELFEGINRTKDPSRWMPFESRKSAFTLMEDWCGYSPNQNQIRQREDSMQQSLLDQQRDNSDKGTAPAAMEIEKRNLRTAALSAMATLCGGPISITTESGANLQFDVRRMLSWIDNIFNTVSDRLHVIGRRALKNLIVHNKEYPYLLGRSIENCYLAETGTSLGSYAEVIGQVLSENENYPIPFWKLLGAGLFMLGNEKSEIRMRAAQLLRLLEERQQKTSKIQDLDISISDRTTAVYKLAQFEISKRLAKQHSELAFLVFSEFTVYFKSLRPNHQRNMVAVILPWIQTMELQLDPNGGPTAQSYMLLANLFELTIRSGGVLHNEVQALWQALATGPYGGNIQVVLDFIISLCLDRREQNFVDYAKQIVVFLSSTPAGLKVVEFLLLQITPKAMVQEKRDPLAPPPEAHSLPYLADLSLALPIGHKQSGFSLGQLALILLVDLMVSPVQLDPENVPLLLQVVLVLWDHYIPPVQEQAREMLVHLIHELVISRVEDENTIPSKHSIEDLIDCVRQHEPKVVWAYEDSCGKDEDGDGGNRVPPAMAYVTEKVVEIFTLTYPGIREQWAKTTLSWATSCPVRHLAYQNMLADMLARLSNTIADDETDIQTFSMEILTTLKTIIGALDPEDVLQYPQLFWTTTACLDTIHEREFMESLSMLEGLMDKVDFGDPENVRMLMDTLPPKWEGDFEGVEPLIYKGLKSSASLTRTLYIMERLAELPNNVIIGDDSRLLFAVLANLPRFLQSFETGLPWFKIKTMELLCVIIPDIDMRKPEISSHGPDLISPLLRLLQTEFCPQALEVLDHIMTMSGTPMDKHHLRMSMAGSHSHAIRKEYERTQSLFGIPEETGWSIPMPAVHSTTTRRNVHAVFYTCASAELIDTDTAATPEVEFHTDEFQFGSYIPDRTITMMSDEGRGDGNIGELVMKLDSLDDFFEDHLATDNVNGDHQTQELVDFPSDVADSSASLYDQETLPILHKSLARTSSVSSFQTGFADVKAPGARDPGVMTPTAFAIPQGLPGRPSMHSRSVTSPAVNSFQTSTGIELLSDDDMDEIFSDDEHSTTTGQGNEGSFFLENMIRPLAHGTRSGMRRLTGGGGKERERQRDALRAERKFNMNPSSPRVPKVPSAYMQGSRSQDI
ncbi:MAG: hypothetical protein M1819_005975 [Sarea resinae]|nr:MAG: hypothetical protein M1819_005975 [Sarea resinae]